MASRRFNHVMDELYSIVNITPTEDTVTKLVRHAAMVDHVQAIEALAMLLMMENTRRRHAEAKYEELRKSIDDAR